MSKSEYKSTSESRLDTETKSKALNLSEKPSVAAKGIGSFFSKIFGGKKSDSPAEQ